MIVLIQCFFCEQERDFDDLCQLIRDKLIADEKQALFEICNERPEQYSPSVDCIGEDVIGAECNDTTTWTHLNTSPTKSNRLLHVKYLINLCFFRLFRPAM